MGAVEETLAGPDIPMIGNWSANVATSAADILETVMVTIPAFDLHLQWGPCRWMPRGDSLTYPQRGDEALVVFDNKRHPWIIAWWPV